jgi:GTP-binding protein HflX
VGDHKQIEIPNLDRFRSSSTRFKGLRLIHTHLNQESLSRDDLTDLALLRLDLIGALEVERDGLPGRLYLAHLIPENAEGKFWVTMDPVRPSELSVDFTGFIQALEEELAKKQKARKIESADRAILIHVSRFSDDQTENSIEELKELAESSGVQVYDTVIQHRPQPDPKLVIGKGKLADIVIHALQIGATLLIFDHELTAAQIRSISDFTDLRVIDRTQLILDIFAQRANSREGKIQVELAQLNYLLPRLITKNTAMSRLTGGIGGRGPGETKLEINRRRARERIGRLEQDLKKVQRERSQRRIKRNRAGLPIISIVGYTNAGKSTLLNALTNSNVFTENRMFATLDPKSSRLRFPRDSEAIITDTVGFIRDLPRELMAAFRSTLEELHEADLLLHVIDISSPHFEEHISSVDRILEELEIADKPALKIFNKADLFPEKIDLENLCRRFQAKAISALHPETLQPLVENIELLLPRTIHDEGPANSYHNLQFSLPQDP